MSHPACCVDPNCDLEYISHLRGFAVSAHATPTRKPDVVRIDRADKALEVDGAAYRSLRKQGYQPHDVDGCHQLTATAKDVHDIERTPRPVEGLELCD